MAHESTSARRFGWGRWGAVVAFVVPLQLALAQEAVRPEVGKPLQAAQELIKGQKFKDALAKVRDADAVANKTANESFLIERMRIAAASGAGDVETAAKSFEALSASGKLSGPEKVRMVESLAGAYYRAKDYAKAMLWSQRYFKEGGSSPSIRTLLIQSQYLSGDFSGAAKELMTEIQAAEKAGTAPPQERLNLLLNAGTQMKDPNTTVYALERLVTYYPKKEYWVDLLSRMQRKPNFSDRLALDTYRLSLATGSMTAANDFMEMAQLALQAGLPAEGKQVVDKGFASGVLGNGAEGERHKRLRDLVNKKLDEDKTGRAEVEKQALADKDGTALVNAGFNLVYNNQAAKGLPMMQQGITKGGLKRPDDARLHLAIAHLIAGDSAKAQGVLKTVGGNDGTADLARLWALYAKRKS
jgi:outer membrane protein assembly factor BamD (BamD/ComL family)